MIRRPPRSTRVRSSAASDVYKRRMTTYDEHGGYPHPDHVMCHTVSMSAFAAAGDPNAYAHAGQPWQPLKIYYSQTLTKGRILAYHDAMEAAGLESPYSEWISRWQERGAVSYTH